MELRALPILAALLVSATATHAQDDRAVEVRMRNDCRLAAQVLASGHLHPRYEWARARIVGCVDEGPAYFASQWATAPADTAALREILAGSTIVRDRRVYETLRQVASNPSRPPVVRVAAMIGLAGYVDPSISIDLSELRVPEGAISRIRFRGGTALDVVQVPGAQPVGPIRVEVSALLNRIAADRTSEPREVWYAAAVLARRVAEPAQR